MKYYEAIKENAQKLVSDENYSGIKYFMLRLCVVVALAGLVGMFFGYAYSDFLTERNINYRDIQGYSIAAVFVGWVLFMVFCRTLGISARRLTYEKFLSIMKNQVEMPFDMERSNRKKVANSLVNLSDDWRLFSTIYGANPDRCIHLIITGPGGVYALNCVYSDPKKKEFKDPAIPLLAGKTALELRINHEVTPIIYFRRSKRNYIPRNKELKTYSFQELNAYLSNRPDDLISPEKLAEINAVIFDLAKIDPNSEPEVI